MEQSESHGGKQGAPGRQGVRKEAQVLGVGGVEQLSIWKQPPLFAMFADF